MIAYMRRLEVGQLIVVFVTYLVFFSGERSRQGETFEAGTPTVGRR